MIADPDTEPPEHLSKPSAALWRDVVGTYELHEYDLEILRHCLEATDRAEQARAVIDADGPVIVDRFDQIRPHPLLAVEKDNRTLAARLWRQLDLAGEPDALYRRP